MSIFNLKELKNYQTSYHSFNDMKINNQFINENNIDIDTTKEYEIFLSHSYADREIIPHLKQMIEDMGYRVYVDWIDDKFLSRDNITKKTAEILQLRMKQSKSLLYATSENAKTSKWMPWEVGYFDGIKNKRVAILPIKNDNNNFNENFEGQEYLGLYYYISIDKLSKHFYGRPMAMEQNAFKAMMAQNDIIDKLYVNEDSSKSVIFEEWVEGKEPYAIDDLYDELGDMVDKMKESINE